MSKYASSVTSQKLRKYYIVHDYIVISLHQNVWLLSNQLSVTLRHTASAVNIYCIHHEACQNILMWESYYVQWKGKVVFHTSISIFCVNIPGMCWFCSLHGMKMLLYSQIVFVSFAAWMETAIVPSGYYFQTLTQSSNCVRVAQPTFENYLKIVHSKSNLFFIHFLHNIIDLDDEMYNVKIKCTSICFCLPLS